MSSWFDGVGLGIGIYLAWCALCAAANGIGDWLIRWRVAGHKHCPRCSLEEANQR